MRLEGKVIVVTGASAGMGRTMVEAFVREGAKVVGVARRREILEEIKEEISGEAGEFELYAGDVSKKDVCDGMIDYAVEKFGHLDALVNNAGIMDDSAAAGDFDEERMHKIFDLNTFGVFYAMKKAVRQFLSQEREDLDEPRGSILNITSIGAQHPNAGIVYCASKAAVESATKHTAFMYLPEGIRCNAIAPGGIVTDIMFNMPESEPYAKSRMAPLNMIAPTMAEPEVIADAAIFLVSDEAKYVNGQILGVNGGWLVV